VSFFGTEFSEVLETKESRKSLLELDIPHTTHNLCHVQDIREAALARDPHGWV